MSKITAPLLSFAAGGQIAKTQVYSSWRGVPYVRRYVVPANPNTSGQQETRQIFSWGNQVWKLSSADFQAPWGAYANGKPFTNRNAFLSFNVKKLRPGDDLTDFVGSPGALGGLAPTSISASVSTDTITVTLGIPTATGDFTIASAVATAMVNSDPHTTTDFNSYTATATATPFHPAITVPGSGTYEISGWLVWTKSDGSTAYGPSLNTTATVS